jgi:hypothetical protein
MASVKQFMKVVCSSKELWSRYLQLMSPAGAKKFAAMHHKQHGVRGMIGSLDCSHLCGETVQLLSRDSIEGRRLSQQW